jgi:PAS domain S-box-containing protein
MELLSHQSRAFLESAPDAIVICDSQGRITYVNREAEAMFRYSAAELSQQPVEVLMPERFRGRHERMVAGFSRAPRRRPMGVELELYGRRKDGTEFPVEISISPVDTDGDRFVSSVIRDVTAQKTLTGKLIEARQLAEQANRAKSQFLAAASHDLRQPLQTLTLLTKVLSGAVPMNSSAAMAVANQTEALRLMAEFVNSLLDIGKLEAGIIEPDITSVAVSRIFDRLRAEFTALAEAKGLTLLVDSGDAVVRTDPTLLSEIIQNLIGNAIRYTRQGWIHLRCLTARDTVRIDVLDTGVGIPANEIDSIFDEFYQAPEHEGAWPREGAGLGLAIARRMAALLGCSLQVTSTVGEGSCFSLTVPRSDAPAAADEGSAATGTDPRFPADSTVMIIDDDRAVANATAMFLGSVKIDCITAESSSSGLSAIESLGQAPGLLICDFHLGSEETGVDVIRSIRRTVGADIPAILVSGDTSSHLAETYQELERCWLLSKPVDTDELLRLCSELLRETR